MQSPCMTIFYSLEHLSYQSSRSTHIIQSVIVEYREYVSIWKGDKFSYLNIVLGKCLVRYES